MNRQREIELLRSERSELERLLDGLGAADELAKLGLSSRRDAVSAELAALETDTHRALGRASISFDGRPVQGTRGIDAEFAGEAVGLFQKLVAKTAASRSGHTLGTRGPIPKAELAKLLITDTVHGSFGFVLEEEEGELFPPTALTDTLNDTLRLLESATQDESFADAVAETDPEVIAAMSRFLAHITSHEATLRLHTQARELAMTDRSTLEAALSRTSTVRNEADHPLVGRLEGLLPTARRFEFRSADDGELFVGRVADEVADIEQLKRFVDETCRAHLRIVTFQRPGKEHRQYVLRRVEEMTGSAT